MAFEDAVKYGFRYIDETVLDRLASTEEWKTGMTMQHLRDQYNRGKLSWSDMMDKIKHINAAAEVAA